MPKAAMDYSKTNIYKIVCNDLTIKDCYVGHTTDMTKRKCSHKSRCNSEKNKAHNLKIYKIIRENGGWDNWDMVLVEKFPCNDKFEACKRERELYEELDAKMNSTKPYRTHEEAKEKKKQYNKEHKEDLKEYYKQYREENKAEKAEKMKQYYQEHKSEINEKHKKYYQEHKSEKKQYKKKYREENKAEIAEKNKQYRQEHKAEINEKRKEKVECEYCSKRLTKGNMYRHIKICKSKE